MADTRWRKAPTLASVLGFDADDLAANRQGHLSRHQIRAAYGYASLWWGMGAIIVAGMGVACWAQSQRATGALGGVIASIVFAAAFGGLCGWWGWRIVKPMNDRAVVRELVGPVRSTGRMAHWLCGEQEFTGPVPSRNSHVDPLKHLLAGEPTCHVYVLGQRCVSIEVAPSTGTQGEHP